MKKQLVALSLLASAGLLAQDGSNYDANQSSKNQNGTCSTCCCNPCCCKPCCVPKPPKCIDCECYTPQFYDLQCDWGWFFDAEYLYWYARETNLSYGLKLDPAQVIAGNNSTLAFCPDKYLNLDADWDSGFRFGIGWNSECDGWDYYLTWTYMHNKERETSSVPQFNTVFPALGQYGILDPWMNASFHLANDEVRLFDSIRGKWQLQINIIDLELGRKYWLSRCFVLRPYAAVRGAWWKTKFRVRATRTREVSASETRESNFKDRFTNRVWGVGFAGGVQPTWYFCDNFALYSNFDVALIWGDFEVKKRERYIENSFTGGIATPLVNFICRHKSSFFQMHPMLDVAIGLRWEECWCCYRYRTALDVGWEHHAILDQNHRNKTSDFVTDSGSTVNNNGFRSYAEATGNLVMGGLVVRLRFDF